jgi:putative transposase
MDGSIRLRPEERKTLLQVYRTGNGATACRRAHILLLLDDGWSYRQVREVTYASFDMISDCVRRFRLDGVSGLTEPGSESTLPNWVQRVAQWLSQQTPEDFGYFRTRWSCETLAEVLAWETGQRKSAETVRRGLRRLGFVWRRPRPVLGPTDAEYAAKRRKIQDLLRTLPADETAVFQDEVDIHLNPKIGSCWMLRGQQAEVVTPGQNVKRHLAGSLVWRTGTLLVSPAGTRRNADLFVAHLEDLRRRLRGYRLINVICDNASFHNCRKVRDHLAKWGHRLRLHFLPKYAPETNPIERIWWRLHETLTRNHRCQSIEELLNTVYDWIATDRCFYTTTLARYPMAA